MLPALIGPVGLQVASLLPAASFGALRCLSGRSGTGAASAPLGAAVRPCMGGAHAVRGHGTSAGAAPQVPGFRMALMTYQPLGAGSMALLLARRTHSSGPATSAPLQQAAAAERSADSAERLTPGGIPAAATAAAVALPLLPPRLKGIGRKMLLRQVNTTIVRRLARRATIGIPILGLYFVLRVLRRDAASLRDALAARDARLAPLFALAVAAEVADVAAQATITAGLGVASGLLPAALAAPLGLAALPALLPIVDKVSIACASVSCAAGLAGEGVKAARERAEEKH